MDNIIELKKHNNIGIAVDVGTTTIGISCLDINSKKEILSLLYRNPQGRYGADIITRIKKCIDDPDMLNTLSDDLIHSIFDSLKKNLGRKYKDISCVCYSGNTTMLHILRKLSVTGLSKAPFTPVTLDYYENRCTSEGVSGFSGTDNNIVAEAEKSFNEIYLPGFSAFVGADILSGAEYLGMGQNKEYDLLVDLGTNGEILLLNSDSGFATSTACGPVFDYGITGAVYGSECIHGIAESIRKGMIDRTGLIKGIFFDKGIELDNFITIRQEHVRNFQMAKAAIYAGIMCLMKKAGIDHTYIGNVYISGGLGFYMDVNDAFTTKLLPKKFRGKITVSGNTSLSGCCKYVLADDEERKKILSNYDNIRNRTEAFELAEYDDFQDIYISSMNF